MVMVRYPVHPDKQRDLLARLKRLGIAEEDLEERFVRGSGRGGQKLNKTSSSVWLTHKPTGILVKCGARRSQALNRFLARRRLAEKLERLRSETVEEEQRTREKIRRKKSRTKRRVRKKLEASKTGTHLR
jgi:protein subunit release factor B